MLHVSGYVLLDKTWSFNNFYLTNKGFSVVKGRSLNFEDILSKIIKQIVLWWSLLWIM